MKKLLPFLLLTSLSMAEPSQQFKDSGADESSPSRSQYFSWINNTNEGATEEQTLINLAFFQWLHDEYGMVLDIYAMDAGVLDSKSIYGSMTSERFKGLFPTGFGNITEAGAKMGTRLGIWGGPDGFGDTPEETEKRKEEIISLCRDFNWALFKFDLVCGPLRPEYEQHFVDMMVKCREYCPDLVLLNHRLGLTIGQKHATTFLWEGQETYIDVHSANKCTAPHNRAFALERGLTPDLARLTEDHGVCISSCIDYWSDDLILQAFNRSLILAPEIYGNPWLMRDDEYSLLARIYNLHRRFGKILVNAMTLPESYGNFAISRGDEKTRFVTLRNNGWEPKEITVKLNEEIGIAKTDRPIDVRRFHPAEKMMGRYKYNDEIKVVVEGFRAFMLAVSADKMDEAGVIGVDYKVIKDVDKSNMELELLALPGESATIKMPRPLADKKITIDGQSYDFSQGKEHTIQFEGAKLNAPYHRLIATAVKAEVPEDADALYNATIFAADNNALEVRSLERSGDTAIKAVQDARDAFFKQEAFAQRGIWDKNLFDGDLETGFWTSSVMGPEGLKSQRVGAGCFRLDLGEMKDVAKIVLKVKNHQNLQPLLVTEGNYAYISNDLGEWERIVYRANNDCIINVNKGMRYMKLPLFPNAIFEVEVYGKDGQKMDSSAFRASNLFAEKFDAQEAYTTTFTLDEVADNSYLAVALNGEHGKEGAYVALKVDGKLVGAPSRATSYPINAWEYINVSRDSNYTYYIPVDSSMIGKKIEVVVLRNTPAEGEFDPKVWMWTQETPYKSKKMTISDK